MLSTNDTILIVIKKERRKTYGKVTVAFKPMPVLYTMADVCKMFIMGKKACSELFHRKDFPAQKYGRSYMVEENALLEYLKTRHIL